MLTPEPGDFGRQLRTLRQAQKLTLKDVEAMTGVHNAYLSQVETGKITRPSPEKLHALAGVLGVPFEDLMVSAGHLPLKPGPLEPAPGTPRTLFGAVLAAQNLTDTEERELLNYLQFLRSRG